MTIVVTPVWLICLYYAILASIVFGLAALLARILRAKRMGESYGRAVGDFAIIFVGGVIMFAVGFSSFLSITLAGKSVRIDYLWPRPDVLINAEGILRFRIAPAGRRGSRVVLVVETTSGKHTSDSLLRDKGEPLFKEFIEAATK